MVPSKIDPLDWKTIINRIERGQCIPFLGAAANITSDAHKYEGLPLGNEVALYMVEEILESKITDLDDLKNIDTFKRLSESVRYKALARVAFQDLGRVALHVKHGTDFEIFTGLLKELIPDTKRTPSMLLETLARIPSLGLIVTTNYDNLMEAALEQSGQSWARVIQRIRGFDKDAQEKVRDKMRNPETRIVYKIHGTFHEEELDAGGGRDDEDEAFSQLIITEDDYIQFLSILGEKSEELEGVPKPIREKMVYSTLLFLGYSLEDWDFRTLFKGLIENLPRHKKRNSFAIQKDPSDFWVGFWARKDVKIYNMDLYDFAGELKARCMAAGLYKE